MVVQGGMLQGLLLSFGACLFVNVSNSPISTLIPIPKSHCNPSEYDVS